VAVLASEKQFLEGLWSLWSWMRYLKDEASAMLMVDGTIRTSQKEMFEKIFPGGSIIELNELIYRSPVPDSLDCFIKNNWTGKKFAAVYELQKNNNVIYSDCDVLVFNRPDDIISAFNEKKALYMYDSVGYHLDPWLSKRSENLGINITKNFNAGLVVVPKGVMDQKVLNQILDGWSANCNSHHAEQTLFSMMIDMKTARSLSEKKYVLSWQGVWICEKDLDCSQMVCRHYTGPTRHRMYLNGYRFLLKKTAPAMLSLL
jgi:lipopolysaccharide biosynthesis glycosyltransferase